jgi:arylsulfatase A-like enzyme
VQTPHLDRLACEGIVFDRHYADSLAPRTRFQDLADGLPNRTWWTGNHHFVDSLTGDSPVLASSFFSPLEAHGVATLRMVTHSRMTTGELPALKFPRQRLLRALAQMKSPPQLVWVDLPSLAPPWPVLPRRHLGLYFSRETPPEGEPLVPWLDPPAGEFETEGAARERLQATYAAMVTYFDAQVGRLLDELRQHPWYEKLLLIVTGDRGLALGEHGWVGETTPRLHEELIHLPLLVRLPGGERAGQRVSALTQPVDLFPTMLQALGVPCPECHGKSLLPLVREEAGQIREVALSGQAQEGTGTYVLRNPEWSLIVPRPAAGSPPQLFVQPDDRWEVNDVRQHHLELAQQLEEQLNALIASARQPGGQ